MLLNPVGKSDPTPGWYVIKTWNQPRASAIDLLASGGNHPLTDLNVSVPIPDHSRYFVRAYAKVTGLHSATILAIRAYSETVPGNGTMASFSDETTDRSESATGQGYHTVSTQAIKTWSATGSGTALIQLWAHALGANMKYIGVIQWIVELCYAPGGINASVIQNASNFNGA